MIFPMSAEMYQRCTREVPEMYHICTYVSYLGVPEEPKGSKKPEIKTKFKGHAVQQNTPH
jgi:hypothetical protein